MTADALDQAIAEGFRSLSAGQPRAALDAVATIDHAQHPRASLLTGHAQKALGDHVAAEHAYRHLTESDDRRHAATGWWSLAGLKTAQFTAADAAGLDRLIEGQEPDGYLGLMHLARAEIWHQSGLPDMAFPHLKAGNDLVAGARPFNGKAYRRLVDELLTIKTDLTDASCTETPQPIFIIGQPRSGTTLVEQILASHPDVDATDELAFMGHRGADLQRDGGYAERLTVLSEDRWQAYREQYLKLVEPYRGKGGRVFLDKAPENFLHVALILRILPNARFVHVVRDPLDNIVSQYRHFFPEGREYSNSLEGLIFYWQGYLMLMRHWSALFPERIYHQHYASLVGSPEPQIEALLAFCSLPAASECFTPHATERPVMTPSAAQVRQPINTAGIDSGLAYGEGMKDWLKEIGKLKEASVSLFGNS
jgi:hypothetical protein